MAYIRCPYCNYRIFTPLTMEGCPNCDQALPETVFLAAPASSSNSSNLIVQPTEKDRKRSPNYDAEADPEVIIVTSDSAGAIPRKERTPAWMRSHLASIKGVVLSVQTQHESQTQGGAPDLVGGFFKAIRDILWPVMEISQQREDKIVITQIRLRLADGAQRDARLEGRLVGASIALGDEITLWGRYRKGTLLVQRAYNHTSDARIMTRHAASSPLLLIISLVVLVIALYVLTSGFKTFSLWP